MQLEFEKLQLSGKGIILYEDILNDNMKIIPKQTELHELLLIDGEKVDRVGWIVPGEFDLLADFTVHTNRGMQGKSTQDTITRSLIVENSILSDHIDETNLVAVDTEESEKILQDMISDDLKKGTSHINIDNIDDNDNLVILSPNSKFVFVQNPSSSVRIHGDDGVYVLKRDEEKEKLVIIDKMDGINIFGDKEISMGPGGFSINGEPLDIDGMVSSALGSVATAFSGLNNLNLKIEGMEDLGKSLGKVGAKIGKTFSKNFAKNFTKNFGRNFDPDIDDDFDDPDTTYDVDVDY